MNQAVDSQFVVKESEVKQLKNNFSQLENGCECPRESVVSRQFHPVASRLFSFQKLTIQLPLLGVLSEMDDKKVEKHKSNHTKYGRTWERYKTDKLTVTTKQKTEKTKSVRTKKKKDIPMNLSICIKEDQTGDHS